MFILIKKNLIFFFLGKLNINFPALNFKEKVTCLVYDENLYIYSDRIDSSKGRIKNVRINLVEIFIKSLVLSAPQHLNF